MKILAIDSSSKSASVAVCEGDKVLGEAFLNCGLTHSVTIMPSVEWLFSMLGIKASDIGLIAVAAGPGSFTGLRIGISTAKGLAFPYNTPCVSVSTLRALAQNIAHTDGIICAVMDARANRAYNAVFEAKDGKITRLTEDRASEVGELCDELRKYENVTLVGDGSELLNQAADKIFKTAPQNLMYLRAGSISAAAEESESIPAAELTPMYLKLPKAERERLERLEKE